MSQIIFIESDGLVAGLRSIKDAFHASGIVSFSRSCSAEHIALELRTGALTKRIDPKAIIGDRAIVEQVLQDFPRYAGAIFISGSKGSELDVEAIEDLRDCHADVRKLDLPEDVTDPAQEKELVDGLTKIMQEFHAKRPQASCAAR